MTLSFKTMFLKVVLVLLSRILLPLQTVAPFLCLGNIPLIGQVYNFFSVFLENVGTVEPLFKQVKSSKNSKDLFAKSSNFTTPYPSLSVDSLLFVLSTLFFFKFRTLDSFFSCSIAPFLVDWFMTSPFPPPPHSHYNSLPFLHFFIPPSPLYPPFQRTLSGTFTVKMIYFS
jgi:hypothetical protein